MSSKTPHAQPEGRLLFAVLLPFLMILAWCLRDSLAYVQETTPTGVGISWQESEASLNLRVGCPPNNPLTEYGPCWDDAARDAARQWNAVGANFTFRISPSRPVSVSCTSSDVDGINTVVWADTQCGMAFGENTLAVTHLWFHDSSGEIVDSDVHFNSNENWSTYSGPRRFGAIDFHRVAIHEFGHVLGLDHPDDHGQFVNAIMNSKAGDTDRLQVDDIAGIRAIYGGGGGQPDPNYCRDLDPVRQGRAIAILTANARPASPVSMMWVRGTVSRPITMCVKRGLVPTPTTVCITTVGLEMGTATRGSVTKACVSTMWVRGTVSRPTMMCVKRGLVPTLITV